MAFTFVQMVGNAQLTNSTAIIYTATNKKAVIQKATGFNADAGTQTCDVWIVPSGGTASDSNKIFEAKATITKITTPLSELEGHVLAIGSTIQAKASANSAIALTISGFEIT